MDDSADFTLRHSSNPVNVKLPRIAILTVLSLFVILRFLDIEIYSDRLFSIPTEKIFQG